MPFASILRVFLHLKCLFKFRARGTARGWPKTIRLPYNSSAAGVHYYRNRNKRLATPAFTTSPFLIYRMDHILLSLSLLLFLSFFLLSLSLLSLPPRSPSRPLSYQATPLSESSRKLRGSTNVLTRPPIPSSIYMFKTSPASLIIPLHSYPGHEGSLTPLDRKSPRRYFWKFIEENQC